MCVCKKSSNFVRLFRAGSVKSCVLKTQPPDGETDNCNKIMYAIVEIKGQQFKVEAGKYLYVHHLGPDVKEGDEVSFDKVLLIDADGAVNVGVPTVAGAKVNGKVLEPMVKGDKVIVFKKKRRKGYRRKNGHRQHFSKVMINEILTA